ncbi:unnamed protein product [Clavelina lepadiformis]|uniref:Proline dehydrogenase n=1 Tax=Clavelina lepadiformis TaxID=159417 RepID=A0ABP0FPQ7_CLALP
MYKVGLNCAIRCGVSRKSQLFFREPPRLQSVLSTRLSSRVLCGFNPWRGLNKDNLKVHKKGSTEVGQQKNASFMLRFTSLLHSDSKRNFETIDVSNVSESNKKLVEKQWDIDFENAEKAYMNKSTFEILRAALVFQLCTINFLVDNGIYMAKYVEKIFGQKIFKTLMKLTVYGHFVAGENQEEIKTVINKLQENGVGAILDYGVEEDLSEEKAKDLEMTSCTSDADHHEEHGSGKYKPHRQFGDRRQKVVSARTYFYEGEEKCDENMKIFLKCIDAAEFATDGGFAAIKLTALGRPQFLLQFSEVLTKARQLFQKYSGRDGDIVNRKFDLKRFENKSEKLGVLMSRDESRKWFTWMDRDDTGFVDLLDWNELIADNRKFSKLFNVIDPVTGEEQSLLPNLSDSEEAQMKRMLQRVDVLAQSALEKGVRLMIDAEQSYFQPAISRITMEMMRKFNKDRTVIMNTYQCYLKDARDNVLADLALSKREQFHFGLKLVRGAYMLQERERAQEFDYDDPIQSNYDATNSNYNQLLNFLLQEIFCEGNITIMAATHNEESVKYALKTMRELDMTSEQLSQVYFGQLLGMCDHITFPLGHAGHHAFKYVPFGPVADVLPYLHRRAQENKSVLSASKKERQMLRRELWRRAKNMMYLSKPQVARSHVTD